MPTTATRADPTLAKALARAFRYQWLLDEGRYGSISERGEAEKLERGYRGTLLRLTLLAPEIVEALLVGREQGLSLPRLLELFPTCWNEQQVLFRQITEGQADSLRRGGPSPARRIRR